MDAIDSIFWDNGLRIKSWQKAHEGEHEQLGYVARYELDFPMLIKYLSDMGERTEQAMREYAQILGFDIPQSELQPFRMPGVRKTISVLDDNSQMDFRLDTCKYMITIIPKSVDKTSFNDLKALVEMFCQDLMDHSVRLAVG